MSPGAKVQPNRSTVEGRGQLAEVRIHVSHEADVAVVDLLVVVVLDLHDLVAGREGPAETLDLPGAGGVERSLKFDVERPRADAAAVHRAQDLDVPNGVEAEASRDACPRQLDDLRHRRFGLLRRHEIEIAVDGGRREVRHLALVDAVGAENDPACGRLTKDLGKPNHKDRLRADDIRQHLSGADRGKLVDVANDQQGRGVRRCLHQRLHQKHVDHRGLVDNQQVAVEAIVLVAFEPAAFGVHFEKPVDRLCFDSRGFRHAFGRAAGWRAEQHPDALGRKNPQDRIDDCRLAYARTTGHDERLALQRQGDRLLLRFGEP